MKHSSEIITINPQVRFGEACIRGMRITVSDILTWVVTAGMKPEEIIENYPELTSEDIKAALAFNIS